MSHNGPQNGPVHDLYSDHDMMIRALEKNDMETLETLRETSLERLKDIMTAGPPETQEGFQALLEVKTCVDRIREDLEQKKAEVFSQMRALTKTRHGLKAYRYR
jgi:hypothetical protein